MTQKGDPLAPDEERWEEEAGLRPEHPVSVLLFSAMRTARFRTLFTLALAAACLVLVAAEWVLVAGSGEPAGGLIGFYAACGAASFTIAVLSGWPLGALLRRPETHYDPKEGRGDG